MAPNSPPSDRAPKYGGLTLDELKALESAGTPRNVEYIDEATAIYAGDNILAHICTDYIDGELFAAARNALPDLLSAVSSLGASLDAAEAEAKKYREALEAIVATRIPYAGGSSAEALDLVERAEEALR